MSTVASQSDKIKAALGMVKAVADAIRDLGSVPSGHLWAHCMGSMGFDEYEWIIGQLIGAGLIRKNQSYLLTWIGTVRQ